MKYEFASISVSVNGIPVEGITSIAYDLKGRYEADVLAALTTYEASGTCTIMSGWGRMVYGFGIRPNKGYWMRRYDWDARKRRRRD